MALAHDNEVPLPENMQPYVQTTLALDNIDRLEETFTIAGTSHRVNGIASKTSILAQCSLRHQELSKPRQSKEHWSFDKFNCPTTMILEQAFAEVTSEHILAKARKKNLLQILVRLQAKEKQEVSSWAGLHISVCNKVQVSQEVIGYLPTIDTPATDMATVHVKSLKIKNPLKLKSIVLVFNEALYAKAMEIQW